MFGRCNWTCFEQTNPNSRSSLSKKWLVVLKSTPAWEHWIVCIHSSDHNFWSRDDNPLKLMAKWPHKVGRWYNWVIPACYMYVRWRDPLNHHTTYIHWRMNEGFNNFCSITLLTIFVWPKRRAVTCRRRIRRPNVCGYHGMFPQGCISQPNQNMLQVVFKITSRSSHPVSYRFIRTIIGIQSAHYH